MVGMAREPTALHSSCLGFRVVNSEIIHNSIIGHVHFRSIRFNTAIIHCAAHSGSRKSESGLLLASKETGRLTAVHRCDLHFISKPLKAMGKETQLLEAAAAGNITKVEVSRRLPPARNEFTTMHGYCRCSCKVVLRARIH